jgi:PilZ domain
MARPVSTRRSEFLADIGRRAFPPERICDLRTKTHVDKRLLPGHSIPSRRRYSRVEKPEGVWVYWSQEGRADTSRVRDLSTGGLFVETAEVLGVGTAIRLDFLVQEGQIRAKAAVRHVEAGSGLGLKFTAFTEKDGPRLAALMTRLRGPALGLK